VKAKAQVSLFPQSAKTLLRGLNFIFTLGKVTGTIVTKKTYYMKKEYTYLLIILFLISNYILFFPLVDKFLLLSSEFKDFSSVLYLRFLFILISIVTFIYLFVCMVIRNKAIDPKVKTIYLIVSCFVIAFYCAEIFYNFRAKSHQLSFSYSGKVWNLKYWTPINSAGFRDDEPVVYPGKKNIYFIGDSFTAGYGINNVNSRFSNIIKKRFPDYNVFNLGINGADTKREIEIIKSIEDKPDVTVLQYFFNDVENYLSQNNISYSFELYEDVSIIFKLLATRTFTFNYVYWSFPRNYLNSYISSFESALKNNDALNPHLEDLNYIINYCKGNNIKLICVTIPVFILADEHPFNIHTNEVSKYFRDKGVDVVDVYTITKHIDRKNKVVNNTDTHASELVNSIIADSVSRYLKQYN